MTTRIVPLGILALLLTSATRAADVFHVDRCQIIPLPNHQVSMQIDGIEKLRWHFGNQYTRPFFYPFNGPSGTSLTRMGHPGAQNHDHHLSVWLAFNDVNGQSFWSDLAGTQIRQKHWYRYRDGDEEAVMASVTGWYGIEGVEQMQQDVVAALRPLPEKEHALELQVTMRPADGMEQVVLGQTNFGFLAVRVSKTISGYFGGGQLTNSEGAEGEPDIFGKSARWMDYSGPVIVGTGPDRQVVTEGITYFDHPANPHYPTKWHVREDGWMGASFCMDEAWTITKDRPLTLRYLLHAHSGPYDADKADRVHKQFASRPGFQIRKPKPGEHHMQFEVERLPAHTGE